MTTDSIQAVPSLVGYAAEPLEGQTVFVNLDKFPWGRPTVADIESREFSPDSRKVGMKFNGLRFRMYNVSTPEGIANYEKDKARLYDLQRFDRAVPLRETSIVLLNQGTQELHLIMEWAEVEFDLYKEGVDGAPVKLTPEEINKTPPVADEADATDVPKVIDIDDFVERSSRIFLSSDPDVKSGGDFEDLPGYGLDS